MYVQVMEIVFIKMFVLVMLDITVVIVNYGIAMDYFIILQTFVQITEIVLQMILVFVILDIQVLIAFYQFVMIF
jgi:hypothetical protein